MAKKEVKEEIISNIIRDKKQLSVRIPKSAVEQLNINSKTDQFAWAILREGSDLSLIGVVLKNYKAYENGKN